jgi:site-specific recombinase XerD
VARDGALKGTKTGAARDVEVTPRLAEALTRWHTTAQVEAVTSGRALGWIFPSPTGSTLRVQTASKWFRRLRDAARVPPHHRLYDLRHHAGRRFMPGRRVA